MLRPAATIFVVFACALPAFAQPQALPAEQLKKIKAATVFVKVSHGPFGGTGSGFVVHAAKDYGLIVTNEHVVEPGERIRERLLPGAKAVVEVVFNSGQGTAEWSVKAEVLHVNREDDLALLKVMALKPIPEPLPLTGADKLPETTPVYVCGFPFGEDLAEGNKNPEISIGVASVSSNRTDAAGEVATVQLNGALNPGNSGGPVVTQDGKLVGVAVRTVTGAGIGFAVPPAKVRRAVQDIHFSPPVATWSDGPPRKIRLELRAVDAYGVLKNPTAAIAPAPNAWTTPNAGDIAGQAGAKPVPVKLTGDSLTMEFPVPEGTHFWLQFAWKDRAGAVRRSVPVRVASEEALAKYPLPLRPGTNRMPVIPVKPRIDPLPPPRPTPKRPSPTPLSGPDGRHIVLGSLLTVLRTPSKGQIDIDELNRTATTRNGERLTLDILTTGAGSGFGDGPSLHGYNGLRATPSGLDFLLEAGMAEALDTSKFGGRTVVARITGTVKKSTKTAAWQLFVIDELSLIGLDGAAIATFKRGETIAPAAPAPVAPSKPAAPAAMFKPLPYPLGSIEAQDQSLFTLRKQLPELVGKRFHWSLIVTGTPAYIMDFHGKSYRYSSLNAKHPVSLIAFQDLTLFTTNECADLVKAETQKKRRSSDPPFYCLVEFEVVRFSNNKIECIVTSLDYRDPANPEATVVLKPDAPELFDANKALEAKRPVPKPGDLATDDGGGPSGILIAGTAVVGLLILGGIVWAIRRTGSPSNRTASKTRRTGTKSNRKANDDENDDDRPRRRSRRDS